MKRIIILLFAFSIALPAYCQTLRDGDSCFDAGDYLCAQNKYQDIFNRSSGKDKQIIEIKLTRVKWCIEHLKAANKAFDKKNYATAMEHYTKVLETNPKDPYATAQSAKCKKMLVPITLSVSKYTLSFTSWGGSESKSISVTTNADSYTVSNLPYWCTVTKQADSLTVKCDPNLSTESRKSSFTIRAGDKTETVYITQTSITQTRKITLSVSKYILSFTSWGGSESISVTTNADSYTVSNLPYWCTVTKQAGSLTVKCDPNSSTESRKSSFTIRAGDKTETVYITQTRKIETLSVSVQNLYFNIDGGTKRIDVTTNADDYTVGNLSSWWCTVTKYKDYFTVDCKSNRGYPARTNYFTVQAGDKEIQINVSQSGVASSTSSVSSYKPARLKFKRCFNCPTTEYPWGVSLGYINKTLDNSVLSDYNDIDYVTPDNLSGIQIGLRFEPLFKYGFGLNTGLYYGYYSTLFSSFYEDYDEYEEHTINVPLHLEYWFNFSKYFNLFVYGGAGLDVTFNFDDIGWHTAMEYGAGLRINHFQLNVGQSVYVKDWNDFSDFSGMLNNKYKNFIVSISYMF